MVMERQLGRFEKALQKGYYLFHLHTDWTDGKSSLADYCIAAKKLGFQTLILTEHIRRKCTYDFRAFLELAKEQQLILNVEIIVGVEAKILPNGFVDVPESVLREIDVLAIAEHSFEGDAYALADSLIQAFKSLRKAEFACVWVHPGLGLLLKKAAPESLFWKVLQTALKYGVYIEFNLRYRLPPRSFLSQIPSSRMVIGLDAHSVGDVETLAEEAIRAEEALHKERERTNAEWKKL